MVRKAGVLAEKDIEVGLVRILIGWSCAFTWSMGTKFNSVVTSKLNFQKCTSPLSLPLATKILKGPHSLDT